MIHQPDHIIVLISSISLYIGLTHRVMLQSPPGHLRISREILILTIVLLTLALINAHTSKFNKYGYRYCKHMYTA
jgi:hypothetical protein